MARRDYDESGDPLAGKEPVSGWGGFILFAAGIMILIGIFGVLMGCVALFDESWFVTPPQSLFGLGPHGWGVAHLVVGLFALLAGFGLMRGKSWARVMGVIVAGVNALSQIAFQNSVPTWAVIMVGMDVLVIYAITVHGRELATRSS